MRLITGINYEGVNRGNPIDRQTKPKYRQMTDKAKKQTQIDKADKGNKQTKK